MDLINRFTNAVIFSAEVETVKELLLSAFRAGADLREANLYGADLREANLREANLYRANAKINGHLVISINGLAYPILITDTHLRAGCQNHTFSAWRAMTPDQIAEMDGQRATDFFPTLLGLIDLLCQDRINDREADNA